MRVTYGVLSIAILFVPLLRYLMSMHVLQGVSRLSNRKHTHFIVKTREWSPMKSEVSLLNTKPTHFLDSTPNQPSFQT